jgi:hypothetical protein
VKFAYLPLPVRQASPALGGVTARHRPIVPIHILHILAPLTLPPLDACIDCAADDTIFPPHLAGRLGIDPLTAPKGRAGLIGGTIVNVIYAQVTLLLSDGYESCHWDAVVAFPTVPMRWALLGHAGFLDFFDVQLLGARREVIVLPNTAFPGKHIIHAAAGP